MASRTHSRTTSNTKTPYTVEARGGVGIEPMLADDGTEDNKEKKTTTTTTDTTQPVPTRAPREADVRRFRINQTLLDKYGYTTGCDGCEQKRFQSTGGGGTETTMRNAEAASEMKCSNTAMRNKIA